MPIAPDTTAIETLEDLLEPVGSALLRGDMIAAIQRLDVVHTYLERLRAQHDAEPARGDQAPQISIRF